MQVKIGEKIRELRRRDGRTQEQLAMALGVTCQAVSRWESGGGYPDMEAMPAIANYFHVTIDELFGYDGDREDRIKEILNSADEIMRKYRSLYKGGLPPEFEECVNMLREGAYDVGLARIRSKSICRR
ncbi:MAG: helix-turn-helix transcriptional regulator [Clostridia bacterium]|nr:helix-turn-helix transcriptional regulator [Clostridia bacterium]